MKIRKSNLQLISVLLLSIMIIFMACKKEISATNSGDEKKITELLSNSNIELDQVFDDVYNNVMGVNSEVAFGEIGIFGRIITIDSLPNLCFTVKIMRLNAPALFPVRVDIDFGNGCLGKDGIYRKGKIITVYNGPLTQAGKVAETSFDDFYMNGLRVEGTQRIENISISQSLIFKVTVKNGKLTNANSNYTLWNSINTITQIEGSTTPGYAKDDVLSIMAESNGSIKTDAIFLTWNAKTVEPLIKKFTCRWIVKGKTEVIRSNTDKAFIDYGAGECDNKANLIINGSSIEITLH